MRKSKIKNDVLKAICSGKTVSGGRLASRLGVSRTANNKIYLTVKEYASGGDNYTTERVDFEYIDGAYKIVNVTE